MFMIVHTPLVHTPLLCYCTHPNRYVSAARSVPSPSPVFCEVGFNAGHSAAILLTAREEAILYEFDLFDRPYSRQSQQIFGHLYKNRSGGDR
jgi:hypothetical protein